MEVFTGEPKPYIARVTAIGDDSSGETIARMQWFYRAHEVPLAARISSPKPEKNEIYLSTHQDFNAVETVIGRVRIFFEDREKNSFVSKGSDDTKKTPKYICRSEFDLSRTNVTPISPARLKWLMTSHSSLDDSPSGDKPHPETPQRTKEQKQMKKRSTADESKDLPINGAKSESIESNQVSTTDASAQTSVNNNNKATEPHTTRVVTEAPKQMKRARIVYSSESESSVESVRIGQQNGNVDTDVTKNKGGKQKMQESSDTESSDVEESSTGSVEEGSDNETGDSKVDESEDEEEWKHNSMVKPTSANSHQAPQTGKTAEFGLEKRRAIENAKRALEGVFKGASAGAVAPREASVGFRDSESVPVQENVIISAPPPHKRTLEGLTQVVSVSKQSTGQKSCENASISVHQILQGKMGTKSEAPNALRSTLNSPISRRSKSPGSDISISTDSDDNGSIAASSLLKKTHNSASKSIRASDVYVREKETEKLVILADSRNNDKDPLQDTMDEFLAPGHRTQLQQSDIRAMQQTLETVPADRVPMSSEMHKGVYDVDSYLAPQGIIRVGKEYQVDIPIYLGSTPLSSTSTSVILHTPEKATQPYRSDPTFYANLDRRGAIMPIALSDAGAPSQDARKVIWVRVCTPLNSSGKVRVCPFDVCWPKDPGCSESFIVPSAKFIMEVPLSAFIAGDSYMDISMLNMDVDEPLHCPGKGLETWSEEEYEAFCRVLMDSSGSSGQISTMLSRAVQTKTPAECVEMFWVPRRGIGNCPYSMLSCSYCSSHMVPLVGCKCFASCRTAVCKTCFREMHGRLIESDRENDQMPIFERAKYGHWFCKPCISKTVSEDLGSTKVRGPLLGSQQSMGNEKKKVKAQRTLKSNAINFTAPLPVEIVGEDQNLDSGKMLAQTKHTTAEVIELHDVGLISAESALERIRELLIMEAEKHLSLLKSKATTTT